MSELLRWSWHRLTSLALVLVVCVLTWVVYQQGKRLTQVEGELTRPQVGRQASARRQDLGPKIQPPVSIPVAGAARKGSATATVAIVAYSDFQCPFCATFVRNTQREIEREFVDTGKAVWVFKHFPLESIHPIALASARLASCAGEQGRFWEVHDRLFESRITAESLLGIGKAAGLEEELTRCMQSDRHTSRIRADLAEGREFGVTGTPAFLIGQLVDDTVLATRRISGARPIEEFRIALRDVLGTGAVLR